LKRLILIQQSLFRKISPKKKILADTSTLKQRLPFSSSIFSCRKYRSLPDLSFIAQQEQTLEENNKQAQKRRGHQRKLTSGTIDTLDIPVDRPISHSKSAILRVVDAATKPTKEQLVGARRQVTFNALESDSEDEERQKKEKTSVPRPVSDIADGALSDSEIDRQRFEPVRSFDTFYYCFLFPAQRY
jgi:hypothetical protein